MNLLWAIVVVLLVLWALGLVTSTTLGGFVHLLLAIAIVIVLVRIIPRGGNGRAGGRTSCAPFGCMHPGQHDRT
jgi:hypothetical protein